VFGVPLARQSGGGWVQEGCVGLTMRRVGSWALMSLCWR
jgi:hypothetical protein